MLRPRSTIALLLLLLGVARVEAMPLRVMSFNTWHAGSQVDGGVQKIVDAIVATEADVVALQESEGGLATAIAAALGWSALQGPGSVAIVSRFPITEVFPLARDAAALGVRLRVVDVPVRDVIVWAAHLGYTSYGPYAACDGASISTLKRGESRSGRIRQVRDVLRLMRRQLPDADAVPVVLAGDFNAPSHLDWVPATAGLHCGVTMPWPVSQRVETKGMVDVFRAVHPDPGAAPGITWSTVYPAPDEPQDRIDFVYAKGATPLAAETFVVGTPAAYPNHAGNEWPSDHAGVLATVDVVPTAGVSDAEPQLSLDRATYGPADPIVATVAHGPGNGSDWIGIYHAGDDPHAQSPVTWRYLNGTQTARRRGKPDAIVTLPAGTVPAGDYVAHLLYADGHGVLTSGVPFVRN